MHIIVTGISIFPTIRSLGLDIKDISDILDVKRLSIGHKIINCQEQTIV
jgi:hypothetical protein